MRGLPLFVAASSLTFLAACGGGSSPSIIDGPASPPATPPADPGTPTSPVDPGAPTTPTDPGTPTDPTTPVISSRIDDANNAFDVGQTIRGDSLDLLSLPELRAVGSATYAGPYLLISRSGVDGFIGDGKIDIAFAGDGTVGGTVDNFVHVDQGLRNTLDVDIPNDAVLTPIPGELSFTRVALNEAENIGFATIRVEGTLEIPNNISGIADTTDFNVGGPGITVLFTEDRLVGRNGLFITPDGSVSFSIYDSLFVGDIQVD